MPRFYACDHCGRSGGITLGVYYPGRDMSKPPLRLCQTYNGVPVQPNCYHLVVEIGEEVGLRKENAILDSDRHSPKVEAVAIRNRETPGGTIYSEVVREGHHELHGQSVPLVPPDAEISPAITEAEKAKGILDPYGASQKPLMDPHSPEAKEYLDRLAAEEAAKITIPAGNGGQVGHPDMQPGRYLRDAPSADPINDGPIVTQEPTELLDPVSGEPFAAPATSQTVEPGSAHVSPADPNATKTPAQIAAEAQKRADEEEAAKAKSAPPAKKTASKKAPAKKAAQRPTSSTPSQTES